jgi:hypothetical protein
MLLPLLLTQCGLVGSAANILTAPVRVAQGLAGGLLSDASALGEGQRQLGQRAQEVQSRGVYRGKGPVTTETGAMTAWQQRNVVEQP